MKYVYQRDEAIIYHYTEKNRILTAFDYATLKVLYVICGSVGEALWRLLTREYGTTTLNSDGRRMEA